MAIAVVARRPDLLVLAAPLAIVAGWSTLGRPQQGPTLVHELADATVREGDATTWRAQLSAGPGVDVVTAVMPPVAWLDSRPASGVVTSSVSEGVANVAFAVRSTRWGQHRVERVTVAASSVWGAFRSTQQTSRAVLTSLPQPSVFDSSAALRRSTGLVGLDRSTRPGDGTEFAGIRQFQTGDRMRRINWPRSLRAGTLHVTSTWADQDNLVLLEVDATDDVGVSEGIDGAASSLDLAVRAAGAIAEHHVQRGDRVTLRVFGSLSDRPMPPASGRVHLRRILESLAMIRAGSDPRGVLSRGRLTAPPDALVIMLSPLVSAAPLDRAVALARRGITVVVVDTLPAEVVDDPDPLTALAWRIRLLERRREVRIAQEVGVPVVQWRGPGSLDQFLRDVARRASAPRMAAR
jgi:uncharacterized protein (DUF58 family)